jgi:hypothetical protein
VKSQHITLLIEEFSRLVSAAPDDLRYPALERAWSRGRAARIQAPTPNHLRFSLFGIEPEGELPVAALTHVNDRNAHPGNEYFWLRADPVTMWADMARVIMTNHGFADLDPYERNEIEICVRDVLREEGIDLHGDHPERWCIALQRPIEFAFTPLDEALGMDVAEALPGHPEARHWRRVLTEVQIALHNCPVNVKRRAMGKREINSVWFWGGGFMPDAAEHDTLDTVYSENAVSRGLAIINDCHARGQAEALECDFAGDGKAILIDWSLGSSLDLAVYDGYGIGCIYGPTARRRFWQRRKPLAEALRGVSPS